MSACESEAWRTAGIVSVEQQHRKGYSVEPTPHFGKYDHLAIRLNPSCTKRLNPKLVTVRTVNTQTDTCARGICRACRWVFTNQKTICLPKEGTGCRMLLFFFFFHWWKHHSSSMQTQNMAFSSVNRCSHKMSQTCIRWSPGSNPQQTAVAQNGSWRVTEVGLVSCTLG